MTLKNESSCHVGKIDQFTTFTKSSFRRHHRTFSSIILDITIDWEGQYIHLCIDVT